MKLYTIGYERTSLPQLVEKLHEAGVQTLIDVRELPNSRRAGFSKRMLAATLATEGIEYQHFRALGTPKEGRIANRRRQWTRFWAIVDAQLATDEASRAFEQAGEIARARRSCLLCLEADHSVCHRDHVARELARRFGFTIEHLSVEPSALL